MKIGNNRILAGLMIGCGAASLVLGVVAGTPVSIGVGALGGLMGALFLANPVAVIGEGVIEVRNPLGMTLKRIPYGSRADLVVRGGKLFVRSNGVESKTGIGGFGVHQPDLEAVARWISAG